MKKRQWLALATVCATLASLVGCSAGGGGAHTVKVAFEDYGGPAYADYFARVAKQFEKAHPGDKVQLVPIKAAESDYYTKLGLMNRSASTAPDVLYEDTFLIKSDAAAGYLAPLDSYLSKWSDWSQFYTNAKSAGAGVDGKTYGVSMGTDTRALWYNKTIFQKAGIDVPWKPKTWADVLAAAKAVKAKVPGVIPINVFAGVAAGEAASMQGFEMLRYGTPSGGLTNDSGKWLVGSPGYTDSLTFMKEIYGGGLGPSPAITSSSNYATDVATNLLPKGGLAIDLDGSWLPLNWAKTGGAPWPAWTSTMGYAPMPTQNGQAPGGVSLSGGWTLSLGSKSKNPSLAVQFIELALNKANSLDYDITIQQVPVRKDVAAAPSYVQSSPSAAFFSSLVAKTYFRPATPDYAKISNEIQQNTEAVISGQQSPQQAAQAYDQAVLGIVGKNKTAKG